jgi:hypothetical protein
VWFVWFGRLRVAAKLGSLFDLAAPLSSDWLGLVAQSAVVWLPRQNYALLSVIAR